MSKEQIKAARRKLGVTVDGLAKMLGVTGQSVRRWECGVREMPMPTLKLLRRMLAEKRR